MNEIAASSFQITDSAVRSVSTGSNTIFGGTVNDTWALSNWLGFVRMRNTNTYRSYKKEVERFRTFLHAIYEGDVTRPAQFLLRDATDLDVMRYEAQLKGFMRTGEPVPLLIIPSHILRQHGLREQPFVTYESGPDGGAADSVGIARQRKPKDSSTNLALSILHALYSHWTVPDPQTKQSYVGANPVKRIKKSSNRMQRQVDRNFPLEAIQAMMHTIELQIQTESNANQLIRRRWITALLFGLWGRRAEIASIKMQDFYNDGIRWSVDMKRKGGKEQRLPVAPWVIKELMTYRRHLGLAPLPSRTEEFAAIQRLRAGDPEKNVDPNLIYREVSALCTDASQALRKHQVLPDLDGINREMVALKLDEISPHWFRHSGASIAINTGAMTLENASNMLGHSSPIITAEMYYHPETSQIADGMERIGKGVF